MVRRILGSIAMATLVLGGCSSPDSANQLTPDQAKVVSSQASRAASQAASDAAQQMKILEIADAVEDVALAVKAYSDLGEEIEQSNRLDRSTLSAMKAGIGSARTAVDQWTAYVNGISGSAITSGLGIVLEDFTSAAEAYVEHQEEGFGIWERCLGAEGARDTEAAACILQGLDMDKSIRVFEKYIETLQRLGAELGMTIS